MQVSASSQLTTVAVGGNHGACHDGERRARRACDAGHRVPGPDLPQRLRADPADQLPGGGVPVRAPGVPVPVAGAVPAAGDRFRKAVVSFSDANDIPWIKFEKDQAKLEVMAPHLARQAGTGRSGVAAIGVAQEFQRVWTAYEGKTSTGTPRWSFVKTRPAGDLLLLLPVGRRFRPGVHQGVRLFPLSGQDLAQRA